MNSWLRTDINNGCIHFETNNTGTFHKERYHFLTKAFPRDFSLADPFLNFRALFWCFLFCDNSSTRRIFSTTYDKLTCFQASLLSINTTWLFKITYILLSFKSLPQTAKWCKSPKSRETPATTVQQHIHISRVLDYGQMGLLRRLLGDSWARRRLERWALNDNGLDAVADIFPCRPAVLLST